LNIIEIGAGSGELAASLLRELGWWKRPRYHIVEISPRLRQAQQKRIGSSALWHRSLAEALEACQRVAVVLSNELVDAFPCRVFKKDHEGWSELALRVEKGRAVEEWIAGSLPESTAFAHPWPLGQRLEVHESFQSWLRDSLPAWESGTMLTIDYGDECPALYLRRPHGTLRAYAHHQRLEGREVYAGFGLRDLTADVNFSDLQHDSTLLTASYETLGEFITRNDPSLANDRAQILHAPGGAGDAFKVLVQTR
jgi:SAM-dependent MidA family methyltransferase